MREFILLKRVISAKLLLLFAFYLLGFFTLTGYLLNLARQTRGGGPTIPQPPPRRSPFASARSRTIKCTTYWN
ncbi:MAG: hypothetical protein ACI4RT_09170 [Candidatus Spyradenecus sp.]